ncbi:hypothetical protein IVB08_10055 [Bradyrhizobium sp. 173]|uniref:hypothetical protein n=1 Tax=Bradyrhizobium sp. 173 TaxID=2782644 RepID=UPI001FF9BAF8|nr:hypothetical protein [Bradyrhizobium sp. 173]MCK1564301.1 hypothetical protein [Bradyrhizobium sp. 173]
MAQLVFVHGVATRDTSAFRAAMTNREKLFRDLVFKKANVEISSPMWGKLVPSINQEVFETDKGVKTYSLNLGGSSGLGGGLGANQTTDAPGVTIEALGKKDPVAALDAICAEIFAQAEREQRDLNAEELLAFERAADLITSDTASEAFAGEGSAETIAAKLTEGATGTYSIGSKIQDAISAVTDRVRNVASTLGFDAIRDSLSPAVGLFLGDVFVYLKEGERRQAIRDEVGGALIKAHDATRAGKGPLVVVGHSMGGVILVDMLMNPKAAGLPDDFSINALITVGSQPGFFAALDLLSENVPPTTERCKPACVKNWLNVFDPIDPLAFRTDMIFKDANDLAFNSVTGITAAHTTYFQRPQFYARTRKRLQEFGVL